MAPGASSRIALAPVLALILGMLPPCPAFADVSDRDVIREIDPKLANDLDELERKWVRAKNKLLGIKDPDDPDAIAAYEAELARRRAVGDEQPIALATPPTPTRGPDTNTGLKSPDEIRAALRPGLYAVKEQFVSLGLRTSDALRTRYSQQVDECKRTIATGDATAATAACQRAEATMRFCDERLYPEFERRATRLTSEYEPYFGEQGRFRNPFTFCEAVLRNIDDPARLLRQAQFRLSDDSCYSHLAVISRMVRNGEMPKYPQPWQQTPQVYAEWMAERCPKQIADKALSLAGLSPTADPAADLNGPSPALAALPRRGGSESTNLMQRSVTQAAEDAADPAAAAARRAAEAQAREEAAQRLRQSGADAAAQLVTTTVNNYVAMEQQRLQAEAERRAREEALRVEQQRLAEQQAQQLAAQRQAAQLAHNQQMAQQHADFDAQRAAQLQQQQRAQEEANRWYPPLGCERPETNREGSQIYVNRCTASVEIHWGCGGSGCMSTVRPGGWVYRYGATVSASCQPSHSYDKSRRMCKR
jgi:hypothetical protein